MLGTHPTIRVVAAAIRSRTNLLLWGEPGVGKTAKLTTMAQQWGYSEEVIVGTNRQPEDFLGLPTESDGTTSYLDVDWARRASEAEKAVVIFDELNTGGDVFKAMLRVLGERTVGNLVLPDSVSLLGIANPVDIAVDGVDLAPPIANRFAHIDWWFDTDEWLDNVVTGFAGVQYPPMEHLLGPDDEEARMAARSSVAAYLRTVPHRLNPGTPESADGRSISFPTPRSWTYAMNLVAELRAEDTSAIEAAVSAAVGQRDAANFVVWKRANDLYDPLWAMDNPQEVEFTDPRVDRIFALMLSVEQIARQNPERWGSAINLVTRCAKAGRPDVALPAAESLLNSVPEGEKIPASTHKVFRESLTDAGLLA